MAGFRLTDGSSGCPPTQTPPADYVIPFRYDAAGRLWIIDPLQFRYFGAARHDIGSQSGFIGDASLAVTTDPGIIAGSHVTQGVYTNLTVTNDTLKNMGVLLSHDITVDMSTRSPNLVRVILSARWNGAHHSLAAASSINTDNTAHFVRSVYTASSNPHDLTLEGTGVPGLTLAPGASAVVGAKLFIEYAVGSATGTEVIVSASSAVRAYGYTLA